MSGLDGPRLKPAGLLAIAFTITLGIRIVVGIASFDRMQADPDAYVAIAETIAVHGVFGLQDEDGARPTAFRPPLYSWILSWIVFDGQLNRSLVVALHAVIGAATAAMTLAIAMRINDSTTTTTTTTTMTQKQSPDSSPVWWIHLAWILVAIDPILLSQSTLVMTETLAAFLFVAAWYVWVAGQTAGETAEESGGASAGASGARSAFWIAGMTLVGGLAFLCRPTFLVFSVLLVLMVMVRHSGLHRRMAVAGLVGTLIAIAFWTTRNQRQLGRPIWATTHGGYTLLLANNPSFYDHIEASPLAIGPWDRRWDSDRFFAAHAHRYHGDATTAAFWQTDWTGSPAAAIDKTEVEDDVYVGKAAKATIARRPMTFAWSCVVRLARLWNPMPQAPWAIRMFVGVFYVSVFAAALIGFFRWRTWWRLSLVPAMAIFLTLSAVHSVYWSNARMRAPATAAIAIIASLAIKRRGDSSEQSTAGLMDRGKH